MMHNGLYYEIHGSGTPIVFIHGWTGTHLTWYNQVKYFSSKGYKVVVYDLRGHSSSEKPVEWEYTTENMCKDLLDLVNYLNLEKFVLVGHSYGGMIAQKFAITNQERILKLVLVDTAPAVYGFALKLQISLAKFLFRIAYKRIMSFTKRRRKNVPEIIIDEELKCPKYVALKLLDEISKFNVKEELKLLKIPTLIIVGENDSLLPVWLSEELHSLINGSKLVIIENSEHSPQIENPERFNFVLRKFLES